MTIVATIGLDSLARYAVEALVPEALLKKPKAPKVAAVMPSQRRALKPIANTTAPASVFEALKRLSPSSASKGMVKLILAGQSFAERGERDAAMQRVCSTIAWLSESQSYSPEELAEVLRPSLSVWAAEPEASKSVDEELEKASEKILRALGERADKEDEKRRQLSGLASALRMGRPDETAELVADGDPVGTRATAENEPSEFIAHHAIVQVRSSFWIWDFTENRYIGPKIKDEILTAARDAWPKNGIHGLELTRLTEKLSRVAKSVPEVMQEYGTVAADVLGKFALDRSYYDTYSKKFIEAIAPLRVTEPVYNSQIAEWLSLLAGPQHDKLLDWIASAPRLDKQCCALYLDGVPGAGKGLLAAGLARLWREGGATPLENVIGSFNGEMFKCPLILLDEGLPKSDGNVSAKLRKVIGTSSHSYTEKYVVTRPVNGSVRFMIAANNDNVLAFGDENSTANDLEAIVGRFLRIGARREAAAWLEKHNPAGALTTSWVEEDLIAKHCLWLMFNREVVPGKRFLVEGTELDEMHRKLVMQGETSGQIYEWIARFVSNPDDLELHAGSEIVDGKKTQTKTKLALVGNKQIFINAQGIIDNWINYMGREIRRPSTTKVGATLRKLSEGTCKIGPRGAQTRFHVVRPSLVTGWSADNQVGDEDTMQKNIARKITLEKE